MRSAAARVRHGARSSGRSGRRYSGRPGLAAGGSAEDDTTPPCSKGVTTCVPPAKAYLRCSGVGDTALWLADVAGCAGEGDKDRRVTRDSFSDDKCVCTASNVSKRLSPSGRAIKSTYESERRSTAGPLRQGRSPTMGPFRRKAGTHCKSRSRQHIPLYRCLFLNSAR